MHMNDHIKSSSMKNEYLSNSPAMEGLSDNIKQYDIVNILRKHDNQESLWMNQLLMAILAMLFLLFVLISSICLFMTCCYNLNALTVGSPYMVSLN